jgi:ATP-binding protein involved in chromosome partitioning
LGLKGQPQVLQGKTLKPMEAYGLKAMSMGFLVDEETPVIWRGPMVVGALNQMLRDVAWGEDGDLDVLVIDMPPGTGDIQMALSRLLPQAEMLVVTTPQKAAQKVAVRVADMARRSFMPIVGVVENMSGFLCEHGASYPLFGEGGGRELAAELNVPLVGSIPLHPAIVTGGDSGVPVTVSDPDNPASQAFAAVTKTVLDLVPPAQDETCTGRIAKLVEALDRMGRPA